MIWDSSRKTLLLSVEKINHIKNSISTQKPILQLEVKKFELQNLQPIFDC
jgi:hypothetical protein